MCIRDSLKAVVQKKVGQAPIEKGFLGQAMHPEYFGNLIFILGFYLLSTGSTGGAWRLIGPLTILLLMYRVIMPENERRAISKSSTYN